MNANIRVRNIGGLDIPEHDFVKEEYDDPTQDDARVETIIFRQGGATGTIVCRLAITYYGATNNIDTITRTPN